MMPACFLSLEQGARDRMLAQKRLCFRAQFETKAASARRAARLASPMRKDDEGAELRMDLKTLHR